MDIKNSRSPASSGTIVFLHRITTSGVKLRDVLKKSYLFHEVENAASLYCENNYTL